MASAGIEAGIARQSAGTKGRTFSLRSFHSLRHSFISALANSGVSSELRRKLSGHASEEMHAVYTHHELETIRNAVNAFHGCLESERASERERFGILPASR